MASQADGLTYAAINGTILAILIAALVAYLLVGFEGRQRLVNELVDAANAINDQENIWTIQRISPNRPFDPTGKSASELVDAFEALALGTDHPGFPDVSDETARGAVLCDLVAPIAQTYPFATLATEVAIGTREATQAWTGEVTRIAGRLRILMWVDADTHFGGGRLSRIAKAADDTTRATTAGTPAQSRVEEMISRTGVEAQLALFRGFIDRAVGISTSASRIDAKLKRYDGRQPSRRTLAIGLAITTAAFVCGVVIPMLNPNASHILSADVPVAAYLVALLTAAEVMLRHRTK